MEELVGLLTARGRRGERRLFAEYSTEYSAEYSTEYSIKEKIDTALANKTLSEQELRDVIVPLLHKLDCHDYHDLAFRYEKLEKEDIGVIQTLYLPLIEYDSTSYIRRPGAPYTYQKELHIELVKTYGWLHRLKRPVQIATFPTVKQLIQIEETVLRRVYHGEDRETVEKELNGVFMCDWVIEIPKKMLTCQSPIWSLYKISVPSVKSDDIVLGIGSAGYSVDNLHENRSHPSSLVYGLDEFLITETDSISQGWIDVRGNAVDMYYQVGLYCNNLISVDGREPLDGEKITLEFYGYRVYLKNEGLCIPLFSS